jgi:acyl-homoserine lactone acylase PvdQ
MHTSSGVDNIDEFLETVTKKQDGFVYRHGADEKPVQARTITVPYRTASGVAAKTFTVYRTEHGPVVRAIGDKWVSVALMQDPVKALTQSYTRTKARTYQAFRDIMELHTNSSNNTVFADADGNIAYFHSNYIPKRDPKFDWTKPVDGSDPETDYKGLLSIDETPGLFNPGSGWIYNSNNAPWTAAGPDSPKKENYPVYVDRTIAESPRGIHAVRVLSGKKDFTVESLIGAAFDSYLPAFAEQIPVLVKAWDSTPDNDPLKAKLVEPIKLLRAWDDRWSVSSVATSLAVFYGEEIGRRGVDPLAQPPARHLQALAAACDRLTADFGSWRTPWGDINRFQRFNDDIAPRFDDARPSIPVGFTSSRWGSLASFGARPYPNTKKWYGNTGNSFVAAVEFGDRIRARAVTAGGESGDPASPHFNDQAERYATGNFREVYFYPEQLKGHTERTYHPGEEGKK